MMEVVNREFTKEYEGNKIGLAWLGLAWLGLAWLGEKFCHNVERLISRIIVIINTKGNKKSKGPPLDFMFPLVFFVAN